MPNGISFMIIPRHSTQYSEVKKDSFVSFGGEAFLEISIFLNNFK